MTYEETLSYIHSICWRGSRPGLERIGELCRRLGDPQKDLKFVHVAGTNGKGFYLRHAYVHAHGGWTQGGHLYVSLHFFVPRENVRKR